jgi:predicted metal-dependent hydrolase
LTFRSNNLPSFQRQTLFFKYLFNGQPEIPPDKIVRSKRKTLALVVTHDAELIVRAPFFTPQIAIKRFINKNVEWIKKRQEIARRNLLQRVSYEFMDGEEILFLGRGYKLEMTHGILSPVMEENRIKIPARDPASAKRQLIKWYRNQALQILLERVKMLSQSTGIPYHSIRITGAKKQWGSCRGLACLALSWRLVLAPLSAIDYVVIHELVHVIERNHSRKFWEKVAALCPAYKAHAKWLKKNAYLLYGL